MTWSVVASACAAPPEARRRGDADRHHPLPRRGEDARERGPARLLALGAAGVRAGLGVAVAVDGVVAGVGVACEGAGVDAGVEHGDRRLAAEAGALERRLRPATGTGSPDAGYARRTVRTFRLREFSCGRSRVRTVAANPFQTR